MEEIKFILTGYIEFPFDPSHQTHVNRRAVAESGRELGITQVSKKIFRNDWKRKRGRPKKEVNLLISKNGEGAGGFSSSQNWDIGSYSACRLHRRVSVCVCVVVTWRQGAAAAAAVAEPIANDGQWVELLVFRLSRRVFYIYPFFFFLFWRRLCQPLTARPWWIYHWTGTFARDPITNARSTLPDATHKRWRIAIRQPQPQHTEVATSFLTCCFFHFDINELPLFFWRHFHRDCCTQHLWRSSSFLSPGVWGYSQRPGQRSSSQTKTLWLAIHHGGR